MRCVSKNGEKSDRLFSDVSQESGGNDFIDLRTNEDCWKNIVTIFRLSLSLSIEPDLFQTSRERLPQKCVFV